jgi:predicted AlkP superfamily pyrophosphatase or phosphodiesterase
MKILYLFIIIILTTNGDTINGETIKKIERNPLLIISFDGLRSDKLIEYVKKNNGSNFERFFSEGVLADYMQPSFPTVTFPNHWTLVTGE